MYRDRISLFQPPFVNVIIIALNEDYEKALGTIPKSDHT